MIDIFTYFACSFVCVFGLSAWLVGLVGLVWFGLKRYVYRHVPK
jgi:hypothetical protein